MDGHSLFGLERQFGTLWQNAVTCGVCRVGLSTMDYVLGNKVAMKTFEVTISLICSIFTTYEVCHGAIGEMGDVIWPQIFTFLMGPEYGCSRFAGVCASPKFYTLDPQDYIDRVLSDKPEFLKENNYVDQQYQKIAEDQEERKIVKVMHISDVHLDFNYQEGTNAQCKEPLCCRAVNGAPKKPEDAAGKYGALADCDLPPITAELVFDFVKEMDQKPDVLFWTGDNVAHDIWNQTSHENSDYTVRISEWLQEHLGDVPVYPTPGNHEFFPVNAMSFDTPDEVIEQLSKVWRRWLDDEAYELFKQYGYYSMPMSGDKESWDGFRVIALNTETCNHQNWYLFSQLSDPGNMLAWVEEEFKKLEANGEKAFVIGHVKPGEDACLYEWSMRYRALTERYQHVIVANLFGHTHTEDINLYSDTSNEDIMHLVFTPGSLTTYSDHHPQFRIYDIDYETGYPVKAHKYFFNITAANLGDPKWEKQYELTEEYGLPDMSPQSFLGLTERFRDQEGEVNKYLWNQNGRAFDRETYGCQDQECMKKYYCMIRNIIYLESKDCLGQKRLDFVKDLEKSLYEWFFGPWVRKVE